MPGPQTHVLPRCYWEGFSVRRAAPKLLTHLSRHHAREGRGAKTRMNREAGGRMRTSTDANDAHRPSQHQSGGPPAMPPRQAPSSREALESAVGAGMALPPLSVLLSVSLQGQSVLARRSPCGRTPLEAHARAQGARWMPRERLWPRVPLCCSPKLTHLSTAVPQDTVPHHLRSASRRGRHCMAPQEGLQSSQRRWRATAARYRRG